MIVGAPAAQVTVGAPVTIGVPGTQVGAPVTIGSATTIQKVAGVDVERKVAKVLGAPQVISTVPKPVVKYADPMTVQKTPYPMTVQKARPVEAPQVVKVATTTMAMPQYQQIPKQIMTPTVQIQAKQATPLPTQMIQKVEVPSTLLKEEATAVVKEPTSNEDELLELRYDFPKVCADRSCHEVNSAKAASDPSPAEKKYCDFILKSEPSDKAIWRAKMAILDTVAICSAGEGFPSSEILKKYAKQEHSAGPEGPSACLLFGAGDNVARTGAAFAMGQQCECVDAHDGLNRHNAHISATVLPALFAFISKPDASLPPISGKKFLTAFAIGLQSFAQVSDVLEELEGRGYIYLPGGLKAGFGAVAGIARMLDLDELTLRHAMGIYELQAPRVQTHAGLRVTIWPSMLRDTMAWAAHAAVSAITLATMGFTGIPCGIFKLQGFEVAMEGSKASKAASHGEGGEDDLDLYVKAYPACRWAHAYVQILRNLLESHGLSGEDVDSCHVAAERGGAALGEGVDFSCNVDESHYDLKWPLAAQILHWPRKFGVWLANPTVIGDPKKGQPIFDFCRDKVTISHDDAKSNVSFSRELSVKLKKTDSSGNPIVLTGSVEDVVNKISHPGLATGEYLLNCAPDDRYLGIMNEEEFRERKFHPFCDYGVGRKRAEELWNSVQCLAETETCDRFVDALTRPLSDTVRGRDDEGAAVEY